MDKRSRMTLPPVGYSLSPTSRGSNIFNFDSLSVQPIILIPTSAGMVPGIPALMNQNQQHGAPTVIFSKPPSDPKSGRRSPQNYEDVYESKFLRSFSCGEDQSEEFGTQIARRLSRSVPELHLQALFPRMDDDYDTSSDEEEYAQVPETEVKESTWRHYLDLVAGCTREAVGMANVWRFPYFCITNGGGPFLMAYLTLLVVCGMPMICIEMAAGRVTQCGPICAIGKLCPLMKGVGLAGVFISFWLTVCYAILFAWALFYFFNSFHGDPRWSKCANSWNTQRCSEDVTTLIHSLGFKHPNTYIDPGSLSISYGNVSFGGGLSQVMDVANDTNATTPRFEIPNIDLPATPRVPFEVDEVSWLSYMLSKYTTTAQEFFDHKLLEMSSGADHPGEVRWELVASVGVCLCLTYVSLRKTTFFSRHIKYVLSLAPILILLAFLLRVLLLDGSYAGLKYFFEPNLQEMKSARLWVFALAQTMHSLGLTLGPNYVVSSRNKKQISLMRDTLISVLVNTATVIVVGCVVFGVLGHIAHDWKQTVDGKFFHKDPGLVFVLYSEVIINMPIPTLWAVLFFFILICLGMDSQVTLADTVVQAIEEAYSKFIKQRFQGHGLFLLFICVASFITSIPFVTQGGIYYFLMTDFYLAVVTLVVVSFLEICALGWFYGGNNLLASNNEVMHHIPYIYLRICWGLTTPLAFVAVLICGGMTMKRITYRDEKSFPLWTDVVGWILFGCIIIVIPILAVRAFHRAPAFGLIAKIKASLEPQQDVEQTSDWDPKPLVVINSPQDKTISRALASHDVPYTDYRHYYSRQTSEAESVM